MFTITLLTCTQYKRIKFLPLLFESVSESLKYKSTQYKFLEWIFIDGSHTPTQSKLLRKEFNRLKREYNINCRLVTPKDECRNIGFLREFSNFCVSDKTDIIICQDDDDFMIKTRIIETCKLFEKYDDCELVGTGNQLMYDYDTDIIYTFDLNNHPEYHAVNSTYAYSYKYLQNNHYDINKVYAEEGSFTNDFKNKLYHLSPLHCIVQMSYANNTYNKFFCKQQGLSLPQYGVKTLCKVFDYDVKLDYFMDEDLIQKYKNIFQEEEDKLTDNKEYDITYYTGVSSIDWSPKDKLKLGGSESAIINLVEAWNKSGKSVEVYIKDPSIEFSNEPLIYKGVTYKHVNKFSFKKQYNNLILWRVSGLLLLNPYINIKAKKVYVDLHDHNPEQYNIMQKYKDCIDNIFYKSEFHKKVGDRGLPKFEEISDPKHIIIPNGCDYDLFTYDPEIKKEPWRFVYASSYFRGAKETLKYTWPRIYARIKEAYPESSPELHLYYGFFESDPAEERAEIEYYIRNTPGVFEHGRISRTELAIEKMKSTYHLYISMTDSEICCISLKESLLSKCILVTSNLNIFGSFPSLKLQYEKDKPKDEYYTECGESFCNYVLNPDNADVLEELKISGKYFKPIKSWNSVADNWLAYL